MKKILCVMLAMAMLFTMSMGVMAVDVDSYAIEIEPAFVGAV